MTKNIYYKEKYNQYDTIKFFSGTEFFFALLQIFLTIESTVFTAEENAPLIKYIHDEFVCPFIPGETFAKRLSE